MRTPSHAPRVSFKRGEPGALARRAKLGVVVGPERLHVLRDDEASVGRLVLQLVHRHVLVPILTLERLVAPRAHETLELYNLRNVLLVVPAVERVLSILANGRLHDEQDRGHRGSPGCAESTAAHSAIDSLSAAMRKETALDTSAHGRSWRPTRRV